MPNPALRDAPDRRGFIAHMSAFGVAGKLLPGALWARMQERGETISEMLEDADAVAGLSFTEEERELMLERLNRNRQAYLALRERAVPNEVRTTWGATPYEDQTIPGSAAVVDRLEAAGAILVAKLTLGALAQGDYWYGERTRNPLNLEQGSSGSSAGSAASTAAGLVGFAIGSETRGSIVSPSTRCGVTGLRPLTDLRIGYFRRGFETEQATEHDYAALETLRSLGVDPVGVCRRVYRSTPT